MKTLYLLIVLLALAISGVAQSDLDKMVATERAFAQMATDSGTKSAFLKYMAPDAVVFEPDKVSANAAWSTREESADKLSWAPNYADISSNGLLGYTTGNWEYRPKDKTDATAFGEFFTIWLRRPTGEYRWVLDFGVSHPRPAKYSTDLTAPPSKASADKPPSAAEFSQGFFHTAATDGLKKAYDRYAADDVRFLRAGQPTGMGRKALVSEASKIKAPFAFAKRSIFFETADLAYVSNTYQTTNDKGVAVKGNSVQVWKYRDGSWQIVFDIVKPLPTQ